MGRVRVVMLAHGTASMGPRAVARGNADARDQVHRTDRASMGPRAVARGNSAGLRVVGSPLRASMGPRAVARGNSYFIIYSVFNDLRIPTRELNAFPRSDA